MTTKKALLIIDVQLAMFDEAAPVDQGERLLEKLQTVISRARVSGTPIVYIQHNEGPGTPLESGTTGWEVHPAIRPEAHDLVIQKETPDSFYRTPLKQELDARGIHELILAGIQTEICVDTTCRSAFSHGYNVTLLRDAHSTWSTDELSAKQIISHHNNVLRWFAELKDSADFEG
ncbi:cysteine hydrolase [Paenibacillus rhizovicinus]|uniref:Cysteine hydrolase n=1 Tax=Paenibacillus rhizovicinus TaxID=2704463 RepID=A0A6C0NYA3_9BACL|nr:cysteine hydrolase family protein [Paenibacillus rhizovicinus]QHW31220.1 cysteine hydrolase [Paenibacillus rhizovicinus]